MADARKPSRAASSARQAAGAPAAKGAVKKPQKNMAESESETVTGNPFKFRRTNGHILSILETIFYGMSSVMTWPTTTPPHQPAARGEALRDLRRNGLLWLWPARRAAGGCVVLLGAPRGGRAGVGEALRDTASGAARRPSDEVNGDGGLPAG